MKQFTSAIRVGLIAAGIGVLAASPSSAINLVVNGSFEAPAISPGSYAIFTSIPGWTSTMGDGIEIQNNVAGSPFDGNQHVELDSNNPSNMYQDIATSIGGSYLLSFGYSPRAGVADNRIEVYWDGSLLDTLNLSGVGNPNTVWNTYSYSVGATSNLTRLEFRDISFDEPSGGLGGYLDKVSVEVPEPGTYALFGGMLIGGLALRRRRK
jgi:hypothetical protein